MRAAFLVACLTILSCNRNSLPDLGSVDNLQLLDSGGRSIYIEKNKEVITIFKEVLKRNPQKSDCKAMGSINFRTGNEIRLTAEYSIAVESDCEFLFVKGTANYNAYKLTYPAGMYLSEYILRQKQKDSGTHN